MAIAPASVRWSRRGRVVVIVVLVSSLGLAWSMTGHSDAAPARERPDSTIRDVVPAPVSARPNPHGTHAITASTVIYAEPGSAEAAAVGEYLAEILRPSTGFTLPVRTAGQGPPADGGISLLLAGADAEVGDEGYRLDVTEDAIVVRARRPAGLFAAVQTLRQLLPPRVESRSAQPGPWVVPGGRLVDYPSYPHRGAMLDVSRHFFTVDEVKRYIDQIALYKINRLHLHLSDDQGWRLMITTWPRLATYGGGTEVGGGPGGYYTHEEYREIIRYAQQRYITVIPEFDMPGHTNAALASYAELNCDGVAPPRYTGIEVGFSSLCVSKEITYEFVEDVIAEVAALTPGPYIHIGGDEAHATDPTEYVEFIERVEGIVARHGKTMLGWHGITDADLDRSTIPQFWGTTRENAQVAEAARKGMKVILSPANHAYLDMKYNPETELGLSWAGYTEVKDAYGWEPAEHLHGVPASAVLGVEGPLWSETIENSDHIEFMAFPRLAAIAELGWSPPQARGLGGFKRRLAAHGPRWSVMGIDFYRSPQVPWPSE